MKKNIWGMTLFGLNTIVTAIATSIISTKIYEGVTWASLFFKLKYWNLIFVLWLLFGYLIYRQLASSNKEEQKIYQYSKNIVDNMIPSLINSCFTLLADHKLNPDKGRSVNVHVFRYVRMGNQGRLEKDRRLSFDQEALSLNFSLDYADPDSDKLVICDSFKADAIRYVELTKKDTAGYSKRIRDKIDPGLKWVLACPLHVQNSTPLGVICAFGSQRYFTDQLQRKAFEQSFVVISNNITSLYRVEQELATKFLNYI